MREYITPRVYNIKDLYIDYDASGNPTWKAQQDEISCVFNSYPKEWLITEITQDDLLKYDFEGLRSLEPFWKFVLGNKALLPLLWSMYPNHPNLLPAYYDNPKLELGDKFQNEGVQAWVSKPLFGREGAGIFISNNFTSFDSFV